jgi:Fe-Mn family superoxide dismutase
MSAVLHQAPAYEEMNFSIPELDGISRKAIETHLGLYAGYVKEANGISAALADHRTHSGTVDAVHARESLARRLAFELSGVRLHELFFEQMSARRSADRPPANSAFLRGLTAGYGGFSQWIDDVNVLGATRGPGWVVCYRDKHTGRLDNMWIDLHHLAVPAGQQPVFVLDLWEHAYWDDFGAKGRPAYIEKVLSQTDWSVVERRL